MNEMQNVIKAIKQAANLSVTPLQNENIGEQIIYNIVPVSDDGVIQTSRLELNIVASSFANAEQYDAQIRQAILSVGDNCPVEGINNIAVNGGGTLQSDAGIHRLIYLLITIGGK